jgi:hypothetical protein
VFRINCGPSSCQSNPASIFTFIGVHSIPASGLIGTYSEISRRRGRNSAKSMPPALSRKRLTPSCVDWFSPATYLTVACTAASA